MNITQRVVWDHHGDAQWHDVPLKVRNAGQAEILAHLPTTVALDGVRRLEKERWSWWQVRRRASREEALVVSIAEFVRHALCVGCCC